MLSERVQKAKSAMQFVRVMQRDSAGRPVTFLVPGTEGKQYEVILRRYAGKYTGECRLVIGQFGYEDCPGNSHNHVCYHVLAAVMVAAAEGLKTVKVCKNAEDAKRVAHMGGKVMSIASHQSDGELFAVVR